MLEWWPLGLRAGLHGMGARASRRMLSLAGSESTMLGLSLVWPGALLQIVGSACFGHQNWCLAIYCQFRFRLPNIEPARLEKLLVIALQPTSSSEIPIAWKCMEGRVGLGRQTQSPSTISWHPLRVRSGFMIYVQGVSKADLLCS